MAERDGLYMVARTFLNSARAGVWRMGQLDLTKVDKDDLKGAEDASTPIPRLSPGIYAVSARGLLRRVYWLGDDRTQLAAASTVHLRIRRVARTTSPHLSWCRKPMQAARLRDRRPDSVSAISGDSRLMNMRSGDQPASGATSNRHSLWRSLRRKRMLREKFSPL